MSGALAALNTGGSLGVPILTNRSVSTSGAGVQDVQLQFFFSGGLSTGINGSLTSRVPEWSGLSFSASNVGNYYQARLTVSSGTGPTGSAIDTWLDMSGSPAWTLTEGSIGTATGTWFVEIRNKVTLQVKASATYTMSATRTS